MKLIDKKIGNHSQQSRLRSKGSEFKGQRNMQRRIGVGAMENGTGRSKGWRLNVEKKKNKNM